MGEEARQVYISFENSEYRDSKAELLKCQANLINVQRCLHNLHAIRSNKKRLIAHLHKLISSADYAVGKLDEKMPAPAMPKELKMGMKKEKVKHEKVAKVKHEKVENDFMISNLDKELLELNKRIKELGG